MKKVWVVNLCNAWKEYSSFQLVGVYSNRVKLNRMLKKFIEKKDIENNTGYAVEDMSIHDLHSNIEFVSIEEVILNDAQISLL